MRRARGDREGPTSLPEAVLQRDQGWVVLVVLVVLVLLLDVLVDIVAAAASQSASVALASSTARPLPSMFRSQSDTAVVAVPGQS